MEPMCYPCFRSLEGGSTPFIPADTNLTLNVKECGENIFRGVRFSNAIDRPSPHISKTHCECALHVFGDNAAKPLGEVLKLNSVYAHDYLPAIYIPVKPCELSESNLHVAECREKSVDGATAYDITIDGTDHYYILDPSPRGDSTDYIASAITDTIRASFLHDRVVTKAMLQEKLMPLLQSMEVTANDEGHAKSTVSTDMAREGSGTGAVLLNLEGEEEQMSNWAFLTNTAVEYLASEIPRIIFSTAGAASQDNGTSPHLPTTTGERTPPLVVALNTASIDRENDGGLVPNHKTVFGGCSCSLVVELASFRGVPVLNVDSTTATATSAARRGIARLNVKPSELYLDCGPCELSLELFDK